MALYLGTIKKKMTQNNEILNLNIYVGNKLARLKSSDKYTLTDKNGLFLIPKRGE